MTNYIFEENIGMESVNDYFVEKRRKSEEKLPGVRAGAGAKGREASTARCVRGYERHPPDLFLGLLFYSEPVLCSLFVILSLLWSQGRCTVLSCCCCCQMNYCPLNVLCLGYDV